MLVFMLCNGGITLRSGDQACIAIYTHAMMHAFIGRVSDRSSDNSNIQTPCQKLTKGSCWYKPSTR